MVGWLKDLLMGGFMRMKANLWFSNKFCFKHNRFGNSLLIKNEKDKYKNEKDKYKNEKDKYKNEKEINIKMRKK